MTKREQLALITALMLVCGSPAAIAQSAGATGPGRGDTTIRQSGITAQSEIYARGKPRKARVAARTAGPAQPAAPQPDKKAMEAQRNTALLMAHAMAPWMTSPPGTPQKAPGKAKKAKR
jgi:hypothetical protein